MVWVKKKNLSIGHIMYDCLREITIRAKELKKQINKEEFDPGSG